MPSAPRASLSVVLPPPIGKRRPHKLTRWEYQFGSWLASTSKMPSKAAQVEAAQRLADAQAAERHEAPPALTYRIVQRLKQREDFQRFVEKVREGGIEEARALFVSELPAYMELHREAAHQSLAKGDLRAVASFTVPALDRVLPKHPDTALFAPTIIAMQFNERQRAVELGPPVEVSWEALAPAPPVPLPAPPTRRDRTWIDPTTGHALSAGDDPEGDASVFAWWPS